MSIYTQNAMEISKKEYFELKRSRKRLLILGPIFFFIGFVSGIVFIYLDMVFIILPSEIMTIAGIIMLARAFAHTKYQVLKYVRFNEDDKSDQTTNADRIKTENGPDESRSDEGAYEYENDRIRGCLIGGAAGDALGYTVEFLNYNAIVERFGKDGITSYSLDPASRKALFSDDTQMTLFTAEGLLVNVGDELQNIYRSYKNWLITQTTPFEKRPTNTDSGLLRHAELFSRRAPGSTCLSGLNFPQMGTVKNPINSSKGCGGVMRVSPIAFVNYRDPSELGKLAAQAAAITHGHPLGFMPAALLVHILHKSIYDNTKNRSLLDIINESIDEFSKVFSSFPYYKDLIEIVEKAKTLSKNNEKDVDNIKKIGEGWVGEEALAIAIYSALRYSNDFSAALTAAVNHDGDSDSTGAVTGNIIGAYLGSAKIDEKWKKDLELYDLLEEMASCFYN